MSDQASDQAGQAMRIVADAYERGRPTYPVDAVTWMVGEEPCVVLELGAGTGKLTRVLADLGHEVHATEPDPHMLERLRAALPLVRTSGTRAEEVPLPDQSVDVVVVGQALELLDLERALPEVHRVLRPGGHLAVVWNVPDERVPWVRRLMALLGGDPPADGTPLEETGLFGWVEDAGFKHRHHVDRASVQDLALSRPHVAALPEGQREDLLRRVLAFYDDYGRGMDGMMLPLEARCFRARVAEKAPAAPPAPERAQGADAEDGPMLITTGSIPRIEVDIATTPPPLRQSVLDDDTAMLLIDFR
jgi:SAM-dependent methyltransferase